MYIQCGDGGSSSILDLGPVMIEDLIAWARD